MSTPPHARATSILAGLKSGDSRQRNTAILTLARSDDQTRALVESEVAKSTAAYAGAEDDLSHWHALDSERFHFPEEPMGILSEAKAEQL